MIYIYIYIYFKNFEYSDGYINITGVFVSILLFCVFISPLIAGLEENYYDAFGPLS